MDHKEAGRYWNGNAEVWTQLSRAGYDVYRDHLNTPAFLAMLPEVKGLCGIDIGCGEGHNTRMVARRGAKLVGIDISEVFIGHAAEMERKEPLGIEYRMGSAVELPFSEASFDFAVATMSFMDIPETGRVLAEAFRVIKPGGFLQFSICHPCFDTPHRRNLRNEKGLTYAIEVGGYFANQDGDISTYAIEVGGYFANQDGDISEWLFGAAPAELKQKLPKFKTPRFTRTFGQWLNMLIETGFAIERVEEPSATDEQVRRCPDIQDTQIVAYFLHIRVRKP